MGKVLSVDSLCHLSNAELNHKLAELVGDMTSASGKETTMIGDVLHIIESNRNLTACYPDYCDDWNILMPLALEVGVYMSPLAWERSAKKYRAKHIAMNEEGFMTENSIKFMSDDDDPARCIAMNIIKVLEKKPELKEMIRSNGY